MRALLHRLIPATLSARIAWLLVGGLVLSQLLTGTIWFESRRRQLLEIPAHVFATRVADSLRVLDSAAPDRREDLLAKLQSPEFHLKRLAVLPDEERAGEEPEDLARSAPILAGSIRHQLDGRVEVRVLAAQLLDEEGEPAGRWSMLRDREPRAAFTLAVRRRPGDLWLVARGREDEDGVLFDPGGTIADYVLRIYLLRILMVAALTWLGVRLAVKPLERLAEAAQRLGRDIRSPALPRKGPIEVRRAVEAFNGMQRQLVGYLDERTRFLAAVSHDLRSPITRLRLRAELLPATEEKGGWRKDLDEMEGMVDATLAFMQGNAGEDLQEAVDLDAVLAGILEDLHTQGAQATLAGRCGAPIAGFPQGLRRCLVNLTDNAVRYGGRADIVAQECDEEISIRVRDDGPGIPEANLGLVFEPFYREEKSRNTALGGVGLGLSIARDIALAHGGELTLHNRPEGGLEATLRLPRGAPQDTKARQRADCTDL
ncbi:MAG: ATP-binding protein [Pseudomonadota bacterium]|nr:ATP-binding protein [Pseudomonadota bacterium]